MTQPTNPIEVAKALLQCESVTPNDGGSFDLITKWLAPYGFACTPMTFQEPDTVAVPNLHARFGKGGKHFSFAGHVDVVPAGELGDWKHSPTSGAIDGGEMYGRGAVDMKGAVACMVSASARFLEKKGKDFDGSISLILTADEEAVSINGTKPLMEWMDQNGHTPDHCLLGEPTNPEVVGDAIKIGRRGIFSGTITISGKQGHTAYPHLADNPLHYLPTFLNALIDPALDEGSEHFQATNLQITSVDVGNQAFNIIPGRVNVRFNVRFNDNFTPKSLEENIRARLDRASAGKVAYDFQVANPVGDCFYTQPGPFVDIVSQAVKEVTGKTPELSTKGGASDARFIKSFCPVIEFGLVGQTMHQVNERVAVEDLEKLTQVYERVLDIYFG